MIRFFKFFVLSLSIAFGVVAQAASFEDFQKKMFEIRQSLLETGWPAEALQKIEVDRTDGFISKIKIVSEGSTVVMRRYSDTGPFVFQSVMYPYGYTGVAAVQFLKEKAKSIYGVKPSLMMHAGNSVDSPKGWFAYNQWVIEQWEKGLREGGHPNPYRNGDLYTSRSQSEELYDIVTVGKDFDGNNTLRVEFKGFDHDILNRTVAESMGNIRLDGYKKVYYARLNRHQSGPASVEVFGQDLNGQDIKTEYVHMGSSYERRSVKSFFSIEYGKQSTAKMNESESIRARSFKVEGLLPFLQCKALFN